jgi:ABC-type transport system involved in multi-copper enzyme maturation permease subunit
MVVLSTSPVREVSIVVGKYLAALAFLTVILVLSSYIPLLIKGQGKVTGAQIFVGYLGLWLLGAACLAIGVFASSLTREMVVAAVVAAILVAAGAPVPARPGHSTRRCAASWPSSTCGGSTSSRASCAACST